MTDYISREALLRLISIHPSSPTTERENRLINAFISVVKAFPAADVRPVVRGTWMKELHPNVRYNQYKCSVCGEFSGHDSEGWIWEPRFCPNCGARMEES